MATIIHINFGRKTKDAPASSAVKAHSQFTQGDYDYLKGKGWSDEQILRRWDEEGRKGAVPQQGNKHAKSGEPGHMSSKDASNRFVTKKDIRLPEGKEWDRRSGSVMPQGTIIYKEGGGYRPHWYNGSARLNLSPNDVVSADMDAAKEQGRDTVSKVEQAEKAIAVQQRLIEACKKNGREVPGTVVQRLKFLEEELAKARVSE